MERAWRGWVVSAIIALTACSGAGDDDDGVGGAASSAATGPSSTTSGTGSGAGEPGVVLFADDFEAADLTSWDDKGGEADKYRITTDPDHVYAGSGALDITVQSAWSDGQLNKWFDPVDEIHISMQIKFDAAWDQDGVTSRHLMQLSGNHVDVMRWGPFPDSSFGQAGVTPNGSDFFWIHLTPWNDDAWHVGMAHPDQESMWGDSIQSDTFTTPGAYQHVILHARLNALGASDGLLRLTVNGEVAIERLDVTWRTTDALVFNSAGFQAYYNDFPGTSHVYIDDLVVREGPPP